VVQGEWGEYPAANTNTEAALEKEDAGVVVE
jgi:hypothetical protein